MSTSRARPGGSPSSLIVLVAVSVAVALLATSEILSDHSSGQSWAGPISAASGIWLGTYFATTWRYFGTPYLFTSTYVIAVAVFHLGLLIPYAVGLVDVAYWSGPRVRWVRLAGWYTALSLASLGIAFAVTCLRKRTTRTVLAPAEEASIADWNMARLRNLGLGLAIAAIAALSIAALQFGNLLAYTRFDLFFRSSDPRFLSLFFFLGPTAAIALVAIARTRPQKVVAYSFAACLLLLAALSGNRTWAFFPLLVGAVLWVKMGRRIPLPVAAGVVSAVLLAIPAIAILRTLGSYEDISLKDVVRSREQATVADALFEMGSTINTLATTLEYVPQKEPYRMGRPFLIYLRQAIPNIGLSANYEWTRPFVYARVLGDPDSVVDMEPSDWASWRIIPESFLAGAGTGFSAVAEPYFSFGYAGVLIWFLLLGWFLARLDLAKLRLDFRWLVFASLFFWNLPVTARNSFGVFTKPAMLIMLALGIWLLVRRFTPFRAPARPRRIPFLAR